MLVALALLVPARWVEVGIEVQDQEEAYVIEKQRGNRGGGKEIWVRWWGSLHGPRGFRGHATRLGASARSIDYVGLIISL